MSKERQRKITSDCYEQTIPVDPMWSHYEEGGYHEIQRPNRLLSYVCGLVLFLISFALGYALFLVSLPIEANSSGVSVLRPQQVVPDDPLAEPTWENLKGAEHCLRFATRQYTARLLNVPSNTSSLQVCRQTPAEIHGITMVPHFCRDLGMASGVWGYWMIDFEEPACLTRWGDFKDMGCDPREDSSMTRRFEAALENMQDGDDWRIMCTTTPADLRGFHFPTPTICERWDTEDIWGVWEVDDVACLRGRS